MWRRRTGTQTRATKLSPQWHPGGGGDSAYDRGGDARRKFWIKPLKDTDLGVAKGIGKWVNKKR